MNVNSELSNVMGISITRPINKSTFEVSPENISYAHSLHHHTLAIQITKMFHLLGSYLILFCIIHTRDKNSEASK